LSANGGSSHHFTAALNNKRPSKDESSVPWKVRKRQFVKAFSLAPSICTPLLSLSLKDSLSHSSGESEERRDPENGADS
jgi:hypothetical protein